NLDGGLVIPCAPALAAINRDNRPLIAAEQNDVRIVRVDPNVLVIVAARRAAPAFPSFAAVDRLPTNNAGRINDGRIFRVEPYDGQLAAADTGRRSQIIRG